MILYLDTSALVKLFVMEEGSERVRTAARGGKLVATHSIAYVEACAAFARMAHERGNDALFLDLRRDLDTQWAAWEIVGVTDALVRRAADFAAATGCGATTAFILPRPSRFSSIFTRTRGSSSPCLTRS